MIKKNLKTMIITSIVILAPIIPGSILWNQLPAPMATHFDANGGADGCQKQAAGHVVAGRSDGISRAEHDDIGAGKRTDTADRLRLGRNRHGPAGTVRDLYGVGSLLRDLSAATAEHSQHKGEDQCKD